MISRPLSSMDRYYNQSRTMLQLGLKIRDPGRIPELISKLQASIVGLHCSTTETHIVSQRGDAPTVRIPDNLSLEDCCKFVYENHSPDFSNRLASIGANRDTIVLNCGHICADGRYMLQVITHLLTGKSDPDNGSLPADAEEIFEEEVKTPSQPVDHFFVDPTLTRVFPKHRARERSTHCPYVFLSSPVEAFQCYDRRTGRVHGLTEALWACSVLSASAFNNLITRSGVASCVDMRDYTDPRLVSRSLCNYYSNINVSTTICPDQTIEELGGAMRRDFKTKLKNGLHYGFFKSLGAEAPRGCLPGIGLELSNMGPVKVNGPIADAFFRSSVSDRTGEPFLSFSTFSVIRPKSNIWRANVRYRSSLIDRKDAEAVAHGSLFAMKSLPIKMTIGEAVREIQKFQGQYNE